MHFEFTINWYSFLIGIHISRIEWSQSKNGIIYFTHFKYMAIHLWPFSLLIKTEPKLQ